MSVPVDFDPNCDPDNPRKVTYDEILTASRRITGSIVKTPCVKAHMSDKLGMELYYKNEFLQYTSSFKERGACNCLMMLSDEQKKLGAICATTGNHGLAVTYHCNRLNIPYIIVVPDTAERVKVEKMLKMGAKIIHHGLSLIESKTHALGISREKGLLYINGYDHPHCIQGAGSAGIEILEQVPNVDAVLVPVGGGCLLTGVAIAIKYLKPDTEIYGLETETTNSFTESLRKNERVYVACHSDLADALVVNQVGVNTFYNCKSLVDKMVIVKEDSLPKAILHIIEEEKYVVEGCSALGLAAILSGLLPNLKGKRVVSFLSGGNIETTILARTMERGLASMGRLVKFKVTVKDRPGGMAELCALLANIGVTIRDCIPERSWVKGDIHSVDLKVLVETRSWEHMKELVELVKKNYAEFFFQDLSDKPKEKTRRGPCLAPNPVCMQK